MKLMEWWKQNRFALLIAVVIVGVLALDCTLDKRRHEREAARKVQTYHNVFLTGYNLGACAGIQWHWALVEGRAEVPPNAASEKERAWQESGTKEWAEQAAKQ